MIWDRLPDNRLFSQPTMFDVYASIAVLFAWGLAVAFA